jgi:hypothetical protein
VLELDGMLMARDDRFDLLTSGLSANSSLKSLTVRSQGTIPRGYQAVSFILKDLQLSQLSNTLHTLQVGDTRGTRNAVRWGNVISVLRSLTSLNTLVLDRTEIHNDGFMIWGRIFDAVLGPSSSLRKLSARFTSMRLDSLRDLVTCMRRNTSLRVLDLYGSSESQMVLSRLDSIQFGLLSLILSERHNAL